MTQDDLERAARMYEEAAAELERAIGHCQVAAQRFRAGERHRARLGRARTPRGRAELLDAQAREHRTHALVPGDEGFR